MQLVLAINILFNPCDRPVGLKAVTALCNVTCDSILRAPTQNRWWNDNELKYYVEYRFIMYSIWIVTEVIYRTFETSNIDCHVKICRLQGIISAGSTWRSCQSTRSIGSLDSRGLMENDEFVMPNFNMIRDRNCNGFQRTVAGTRFFLAGMQNFPFIPPYILFSTVFSKFVKL